MPSFPWQTLGQQEQAPAYPAADGTFQYQDPMQGAGFMDRINYYQQNNPEVLMNFAAGMMAGDPGGALSHAGNAMLDTRNEDKKEQKERHGQNATKKWLMDTYGMTDAQANAAMLNPNILNHYLKLSEITETQRAQAQYDTTGGESKQLGTVLQFRSDEGEARAGTIRESDGKAIDAFTGEVIDTTKFKLVGALEKASEASQGKLAGEAAIFVPKAQADEARVLALADSVTSDADLVESNIGYYNQKWPEFLLSEDSLEFRAKLDQLTNTAWLSAYESLRGGGAITEIEGIKAQAAILRNSTKGSAKAFKDAVQEYKDYVRTQMAVIRAKAEMGGPTTAAPTVAPSGGSMKEKYGF